MTTKKGGMRIGSRVTVYRTNKSWEGWVMEMDSTVGKSGIIIDIIGPRLVLVRFEDGDSWWYRRSCLKHTAP